MKESMFETGDSIDRSVGGVSLFVWFWLVGSKKLLVSEKSNQDAERVRQSVTRARERLESDEVQKSV